MKILLINTFYYPQIYGGAEISTQKLAEELVKNGHDVTILATSDKNIEEEINNVRVIRIKVKNIFNTIEAKEKNGFKKVIYKFIDIYNIFNYKKLKSIINTVKPDIVHTNNLYGISPIIWKISKMNKIKVIHTVRDYNLIKPINKDIKKTFVNKLVLSIYEKFRKHNCRNIDYVVFISNSIKEIFDEKKYFLHSKRYVIYNAIDFEKDYIKELINNKIKETNKMTNYVYIGTLDYHKGIDLLLQVFSEIDNNNIKLNIAGKGKLKKMVEEYSDNNNNIEFYGFIEPNKLNSFLQPFDVLIAPSIWIEPFGRVAIDAYINGLPVIASKNGGFSEIVVDKKTGMLFNNGNKSELKKCILEMNNSSKRVEYMKNIIYEIDKYSITTHCKNYERIYLKDKVNIQ